MNRPSTPDEIRKINNGILVKGPMTGITVQIGPLDPADFAALRILPGVDTEAEIPKRKKQLAASIEKDEELRLRINREILRRGVRIPSVVLVEEDIEDPEKEIHADAFGIDSEWIIEQILVVSGVRGKIKWRPFRRWIGRFAIRLAGPYVWAPAEQLRAESR